MTRIEKRIYAQVSSLSIVRNDYTPADGEVIEFTEFMGSAAYDPDTSVRVIWDRTGTPEVLFSTYGDEMQIVSNLSKTGNGSKMISIELDNDSLTSRYLGGYWYGLIL